MFFFQMYFSSLFKCGIMLMECFILYAKVGMYIWSLFKCGIMVMECYGKAKSIFFPIVLCGLICFKSNYFAMPIYFIKNPLRWYMIQEVDQFLNDQLVICLYIKRVQRMVRSRGGFFSGGMFPELGVNFINENITMQFDLEVIVPYVQIGNLTILKHYRS